MPSNAPSRTAAKFMIRFEPHIHTAIEDLAKEHDRSTNAEINVAIKSYLFGKSPFRQRLNALMTLTPAQTLEALIAGNTPIETTGIGLFKCGLRFNTGLDEQVRSYAREAAISINAHIVDSVCWWINACRLEQSIVEHLSRKAQQI